MLPIIFWRSLVLSSCISFFSPASYGQTFSGCAITIPAGSITTGESLSLTNRQTWKHVPGGNPASRVFAALDEDVLDASSFYNRVPNTPTIQEDETLRTIDEEVFFGEALACRGDNCHVVFVRPTAQIAHHWLATIRQDFEKLKAFGLKDPANAKFASELKAADEGPDTVWTKVSHLYCGLEPDGKFTNLSDAVVFCREANRLARPTRR